MPANWYSLDAAQALRELGSQEKGLSEAEAVERLQKFGYNRLAAGKRTTALGMFVAQFNNFLVLILIAAGGVSFFLGDEVDAIAIFAIVVLNAVFGFVQEFKAEKAMEALKKMTALHAKVVRDGIPREIDAAELVPGDLVLLDEGSKFPADLRLIESVNLKVDEALLTGESNPVTKTAESLDGKRVLADQKNMGFMNTIVTYGRGKGLVIGTGMQTEFGKIAGIIKEIEEEDTPLKKKLNGLAKQLGWGTMAIIAVLFAIGLFEGRPWLEMFITSVSLGVAAIPEGLPAVITITLALGVQQMAKANALVRRMPAVEALGSATVICSDKTGTLTRNEMVAERVYVNGRMLEVSGTGYELEGKLLFEGREVRLGEDRELTGLLEAANNCNDASIAGTNGTISAVGDPTELALIALARKGGAKEKMSRLDEVPFSSERKMMTTVHAVNGKTLAYSKGALERMLEACDRVSELGSVKPLTAEKRQALTLVGNQLAEQAYRVLGLAFKELDQGTGSEAYERGLVFLGLVGLRDPPREEVVEAIALCHSAGIKVKIITGDNALTAKAIGEKIGLPSPQVFTGNDLDALDEQGFREAVKAASIFARVNPEHKFRIVKALKEMGEIVAVTGDGVNDAPALKQSDIGIAMGIKGTDVTKEASDIVLRDDNFATIVKAVKEGRRIYANIRSFIRYLLAANITEVLIVAIATTAALPLPLSAIQLLWINLVTDGLPALALGVEPAEQDLMRRKPANPRAKVLHGMLPFIAISGLLGTVAALVGYGEGLGLLGLGSGHEGVEKARTVVFTIVVIYEMFLVFNARGDVKSIFELHPFSNKWLMAGVASAIGLQFLVIYHPLLQPFFKSVPLDLEDWGVILACSALAFTVPYLNRGWRKLRHGKK